MVSTIREAAEAIRAGLSPVELLESCLARIDRCDERLRAWVFVDRARARADAVRLADELRRGHYRGPLHGIPFGVKDIFDVFDWPTAAGSRLWEKSVARQDSEVVRRLREAGAVFVGKTVTTAYASFDPPPTRNPWNLAKTPGGSSSGSAAAVACGMCLAALASQTGGSVTRPASYCGVVGFKPTFGAISLAGVVPLAPSLDHVGVITSSVQDAAILWELLADTGAAPASSSQTPPRLGRFSGFFDQHAEPAMRSFMDDCTSRLKKAGAAVETLTLPAAFSEVIPRHRVVMAVEAVAYHEERLRRHPDDYPPRVKSLLEEGLACPAPELARCLDHQQRLSRDMLSRFADVDVFLTPATTGPAPDAATTGDPAFNSPWSYTGLPTVSFPAGWSPDGLPLCLQLVGKPGAEGELLRAAAWCEGVLDREKREPLA